MTNKEKASLIAEQWVNGGVWAASKASAYEMAEWKDTQFKEYLEKKYNEASNSYDKTEAKAYEDKMDYIKEIINELFKED